MSVFDVGNRDNCTWIVGAHQEIRRARTTPISTKPGPDASSSQLVKSPVAVSTSLPSGRLAAMSPR